jgi:hypothetical protein
LSFIAKTLKEEGTAFSEGFGRALYRVRQVRSVLWVPPKSVSRRDNILI